MARRKKNQAFNKIAGIAAGMAAGKLLDSVAFVSQNPIMGAGVKVGAGFLASQQKNPFFEYAGLAMAAQGATQAVNSVVPAAGIYGLLKSPVGSASVTAVSGVNRAVNGLRNYGNANEIMVD